MESFVNREVIEVAISRCVKRIKALEVELSNLEVRQREVQRELDELNEKALELQKLEDQGRELDERICGLLNESDGEESDRAAPKANFERIVDFFLEKKNQAQTIAEIETGTGIPRSSVSAVLYRTHSDRFRRHEQPGKQANTWRLTGYQFDCDPFENPQPSGDEIPF